jgi:nitronate monooxygenase
MRLIALAPLAVAVSRAGGLGFVAAGTDVQDLKNELQQVFDMLDQSPIDGAQTDVLPIGVGFINWGVKLQTVMEAFDDHLPAAAWLFAPEENEDLVEWTQMIRARSTGRTKIWIQIGSVSDALQVARLCHPDVLVIQGADAGGHGLAQGAGIISLLPEVADALNEGGFGDIFLVAAGGVVEGRGTAACLALGADGVVMGTRFLASCEANIAEGYQDDVLRANDGGLNTVRTTVYDQLRGITGWPSRFNGRGIINQSFLDVQNGESHDENKRLYESALRKGDQGWGKYGRLTAYAGAGVGLVKAVKSAPSIVYEVRRDAAKVLSRISRLSSKL